MKQSIILLALLASASIHAADLEYVGGNRYQCTGSNCAVFDSIQNTREPSISTELSRSSATSEAQARRLADIDRKSQVVSQKLSDDFFDNANKENGMDEVYRRVEAIKAKEALNKLSVDNSAIYAKGFEDGHNAAIATLKKTKK